MFYYIIKYLAWVVFKLFYRLKVYGLENYPEGGGIIAANHVSYLDPPLIAVSVKGKVNFLARGSLFHFKPFALLIKKLQTHPVTKGKENLSTIKLTLELIQDGKKVLIFPEGTRSEDGEIKEGQAGVGMLVQRAEGVVIPVYVHGTYEIWGKHRKLPKLYGKTVCIIGKPLKFSMQENENKKEAQVRIVQEIMKAIKDLERNFGLHIISGKGRGTSKGT